MRIIQHSTSKLKIEKLPRSTPLKFYYYNFVLYKILKIYIKKIIENQDNPKLKIYFTNNQSCLRKNQNISHQSHRSAPLESLCRLLLNTDGVFHLLI